MHDLHKLFNHLAETAPRQYTFGAWLCPSRYDNMLNFTRGGRLVERSYTALGAAFASVAMVGGAAQNLPLETSLTLAGIGLAVCKLKGVAMGKIADFLLRL